MLKILASAGLVAAAAATPVVQQSGRINEVWNQKQTEAAGIVWKGNDTKTPLPHEFMDSADLPKVSDLPCNVRRGGRAIPCNWRVIPCNVRRG